MGDRLKDSYLPTPARSAPSVTLRTLVDAEQALLAVKNLPAGKTIDLSLWDRVMCAQLALTRELAPHLAQPVAIDKPAAGLRQAAERSESAP